MPHAAPEVVLALLRQNAMSRTVPKRSVQHHFTLMTIVHARFENEVYLHPSTHFSHSNVPVIKMLVFALILALI